VRQDPVPAAVARQEGDGAAFELPTLRLSEGFPKGVSTETSRTPVNPSIW
jgi:hypothetical protein